MTKEEIIEMAKQAGLDPDLWNYTDAFERFAKLVAEKEREACAELCDYVYDNIVTDEHIKAMAFKIRARG